MKLGKLPARHDPRTLRLEKYLDTEILIPAAVDWSAGYEDLDWGALGNTVYGDCTCASACHQIDAWLVANTCPPMTTEKDALDAYAAVTGFRPGDPSTDNGANLLDVLKYWRQTGIAGCQIDAFAACSVATLPHAVALFGGASIGLGMPRTADGQDVWDVVDGADAADTAPWSWGGHAVNVVAYDPQGYTIVTWGERKRVTKRFMDKYHDELYVALSTLWTPHNCAPSGLDFASLQADLARIT